MGCIDPRRRPETLTLEEWAMLTRTVAVVLALLISAPICVAMALTRQGLLLLETFADEAEHGHLPLGPLDAANTFIREAEVGHVVGRIGHGLAIAGVTGGGLQLVVVGGEGVFEAMEKTR